MTYMGSIETLEWLLIEGTWPSSDETLMNVPVAMLVKDFVSGNYKSVLTSDTAQQFFGTASATIHLTKCLDLNTYITNCVTEHITDEHRALEALCIAAACLNAFVQTSWTGPPLDIEPEVLLPQSVQLSGNQIKNKTLELLASDSEEIYHLVPRALFLLFARAILLSPSSILTNLKTVPWWTARTLFLQQRILDNPAGSLHDAIFEKFSLSTSRLPSLSSQTTQIYARYSLELGLVNHYYGKDSAAYENFQEAQSKSGLIWDITGMLGKRTRFQQQDVAQLVLVAENKGSHNGNPEIIQAAKPETIDLNDDTILDHIDFSASKDSTASLDSSNQKSLHPLDQCILLAFCFNIKNTNPVDGITNEQMFPFVARVLKDPNNWMVHTMALILRSRLENTKSRTVERAALQLQALVDQIPLQDSQSAPASERIAYFYQLLLPSRWDLERELAEQYVSLGVLRSALQIYERLQMTENVILCLQMLEQNDRAEKIIHEELGKHPESPKLLCILGDITKDPTHYEEAWRVSNHRYARAKRSLGGYHYRHGNFSAAFESYQSALAINPLYEGSWFIFGCTAMQLQKWDAGLEAFSRVVALDHDNSEAWNNLASIYLRLPGRKADAFTALQQAIRFNYDSWRVWQNYLVVALDLGAYQEAITAMTRVIDLLWEKKGEKSVDIELLSLIVAGLTRGSSTHESKESEILETQVQRLLEETILSRISSSPEIWHIATGFYLWQNQPQKALDSQLKRYRYISNNPKISTSSEIFGDASQAALDLVEMYENLGERVVKDINGEEKTVCKDWKYQSRMILKTLMGKTRDIWGDTKEFERLEEEMKKLK